MNDTKQKKITVDYKKSVFSSVLTGLTWAASIVSVVVLVFLVAFILIKGIGNFSLDLFAPVYTSDNGSLLPALYNTLLMTVLALLIAGPFGIFAAIFLVEYANNKSRFVGLIRITAETLSGIPSIVYGLFGMLFFSTKLELGYSILSGALTMSMMILPLIMRTAEEALLSVPVSYREGSFGLGAGKLRTIFKIVLPAAVPGVSSGVILAIGRVVGETAALLYTAGSVAKYATPMTTGRTLAVHMYVLSNEGLHMDKAYATAVVLLILVFVINALSGAAAKKISKGQNDG